MARDRPLLAFDRDCRFCRRFIHRWQRVLGDKVEFRPSDEVEDQFPGVTKRDFARSVYLVEPDGTITCAAEAVFRTLAYERGHGLPLLLYRRLPGFRPISEAIYAWVASHRVLASKLTTTLLPDHTIPVALTRSLFLRLLGVVFLFAFGSLTIQAQGLFGSRGITPTAAFLAQAIPHTSFFQLPTLFRLASGDTAIALVCGSGVVLSLLLVLGVAPRLTLLLLWALYLSIVNGADVFMSFQWDLLLLEAAILGALFAPWRLLLRPGNSDPENRGSLWLLRLLLFRLMFSSGLVKLLSNDPAWRDLSATQYHYWTQPLPGPLSALMHFQPGWVHSLECAVMFAIELLVPFFIFAPRKLRLLAFVPLAGLQLAFLTTGNFGFFNLLTLALCVTLLDDWALRRFLPRSVAAKHAPWRPAPAWRTAIAAGLVALFATLGLSEFLARLGLGALVPQPLAAALETTRPFSTINSYGLFAVMTRTRPEIILEGSQDGREWRAYELPFKPGDVRRQPAFLLGHMPRLDWMMWFASLGACRSNPWFIQLQHALLRGGSDARALYSSDPFPDAPPRYLRSTVYQYQFTPPEQRGEGRPFWTRTLQGPYCPTLTLEDGALQVAPL